MKKFAFTLAETLIVMGIIGVVAALTLPNLNSSTGDKEKVVKLQKIYSNLQDALGRAEAVYGPVNEWFIKDTTTAAKTKRFAERITEFMKISKDCGSSTGCHSKSSKSLKGYTFNDCTGDSIYSIITADGTSICFKEVGVIFIDIDGQNKGANTYGKDQFIFEYNDKFDNGNKIMPTGWDDNSWYTQECFEIGTACAQWVLQNQNMDYLKCPEKLSENVTSCK
ncbi:type II secretion system protein [bacterium]|nr:type II secretion system protein [bacterium]